MKKLLAAITFALSAPFAHAEITAQFTHQVENHEPVGMVEAVMKGTDKNITFHSTIFNEAGSTIIHVWKNGEKEIYRRHFNIGGPRWRVWSSMRTYQFDGKATVEVQKEDGSILYATSIEVR